MDEDERQAMRLEQSQIARWAAADRSISFFAAPAEIAVTYEIHRLKRMSASYQIRHRFPENGIAD